ncbi:natriuretic peptides A-like [Pelobates fuscus]|uniref:natriuretic peptides A-like n=1 Tax=Pelobates fuscus TaxID=191477 RepID=UPI002FE4A59A
MHCKLCLLCGALLLSIIQLPSSGAHPIVDMDSDRELDSFKGVLERLGEKLSLIDAIESNSDILEPRQNADVQLASPEDRKVSPSENRFSQNDRNSIKDSFLKGLRSLQNRKMMRDSGCFGRRIDRIDSFSGMGCNGFRRY